jgi:hypothetical protein
MLAVPPFITKIRLLRYMGMIFYRILSMAKSAEQASRPFLASAYKIQKEKKLRRQ